MEGENEDPTATICAAIKKTQTLMTERKKSWRRAKSRMKEEGEEDGLKKRP